jgi:hypothetical protein
MGNTIASIFSSEPYIKINSNAIYCGTMSSNDYDIDCYAVNIDIDKLDINQIGGFIRNKLIDAENAQVYRNLDKILTCLSQFLKSDKQPQIYVQRTEFYLFKLNGLPLVQIKNINVVRDDNLSPIFCYICRLELLSITN